MKFSASPGAVRRGLAQLGRARALLGWRWEGVGRLLVLVEANRSGVEIDRERFRDLRLIAPGDSVKLSVGLKLSEPVKFKDEVRIKIDNEAQPVVRITVVAKGKER